MFAVILWKWGRWLWLLPGDDKRAIGRGIFTVATLRAFWEVVCESLLHRKIFRVNPLLGYMHMSLAFGWFLLIVVGWVEAAVVLGAGTPLHAHVFFRYFGPEGETGWNPFAFVMDLLLLVVLSGVLLAWFKRMRSRTMGMKRTTRHVFVDRVALTSLWLIFPLRLTAESLTAAIKHNGGFLTGTLGDLIASGMSATAVADLNAAAWWAYSFALAAFFIAMPFSRYMHIFTEVPLIFLRRYRLRSGPKEKSFDNFQIQACSRCGICLDPCQLQRDLGIDNVQSVYFLRDRRYGKLTDEVADNCLMCGLCEARCPVGIELNILRLNSRQKRVDSPALMRYDYLKGVDRSSGTGKVGYFAGCMTLLTPATLRAMEKIFAAAGPRWRFVLRAPPETVGRSDRRRTDYGAQQGTFPQARYYHAGDFVSDMPEGVPRGLRSGRHRGAAPHGIHAPARAGGQTRSRDDCDHFHLPRPVRTGTRKRYLRRAAGVAAHGRPVGRTGA